MQRTLSAIASGRLKNHLKRGGLIAYPTESCYGLGCLPTHTKALKKLIRLKRRPQHKGMIVIGDNPGKDEQLSINNRYLVGQSGKIADGFFRRNPELQTDFRKNVVILNKTPVHTAKTHHLRSLQKADPEIAKLIEISQLWMAEHTAKLHRALWENGANRKQDARSRADTVGIKIGECFNPPQLWLVGYAELKEKGIFAPYRDALKAAYAGSDAWKSVFVYQHFSMNRFLIDLKAYQKNRAADGGGKKTHGNKKGAALSGTNASLARDLEKLGEYHRKEIFGE